MPTQHSPNNNQTIRRQLIKQRGSLSLENCTKASFLIYKNLFDHKAFEKTLKKPRKIACYWSKHPEVQTHALITNLLGDGHELFLPTITNLNNRKMAFYPYHAHDELRLGPFEISEPTIINREPINPSELDIAILPMTGFDRDGNRLGHGAGFYDRFFTFEKSDDTPKPLMIGLAYTCQESENITPHEWDIPMDWVVTDKEIISQDA